MVLYGLGNRQILYHGNTNTAWSYYQQLMQDYPKHALTDRVHKFWAAISKLSPAKLRDQVSAKGGNA